MTVRRISTVGSEKITYLSDDMDRLCRKWCPVVHMCEEGHYCKWADMIRRCIIKISEFSTFDKEKQDAKD